ncbi:hypothetical protein LT85_0172 [Collimonas arenae]|uniref:Uncharacterized protein n=1 Tax=Collimonas arenae TaxID=279058 RepID=A0A0A1F916_9BURK|nr:hypothetical protein [Collimonas arenae]AIY39332.1 hypothetical protein LT85_0172 [Collimonas arenae]
MSTDHIAAHWLAGVSKPPQSIGGVKPPAAIDRLAIMEKQLAEFMQTLEQDEDGVAPPHLMSGHHGCPCCTGRGE